MADFGEKLKMGWWPEITDTASAKAASTSGAVAAALCAGATFLMTLFKLAQPMAYIDAVLFVILGLFILRTSRVAAVLALVVFIADRVYAGFIHGLTAAIGFVAIMVLVMFLNGVRGTFAFHRLKRREADSPRHPEPAGSSPIQ